MRYPEIYPPEDPDYHPTAVSRTMFIDHVDRPVATLILDRLAASDASMRAAQLRVARRRDGAGPGRRHGVRPPRQPDHGQHRGVLRRPGRQARSRGLGRPSSPSALDQGDHGAYVNFLGDEGDERVHAAYPGATWDRLAAIKARYDPTNLFHRNQNIPPAP